jgi:N-sulfoglucosamine sulfohydrolase
MVSWADLTPTLLDLAGVPTDRAQFDGRSFRAALDGAAVSGWDTVFASHTLHEVTMYYPMRVIRTRQHKLIVNLASELPYPFALDLIKSPTWISATAAGAKLYGRRTIENFLHRPRLELYNLERDPDEVTNLADSPAHAALQADLLAQLKEFQTTTKDPWFHYWSYR